MNLTATTKRSEGRRSAVAQVAHLREIGLHATLIARREIREFHITVEPLPGESLASLVHRLHAFVVARGAVMIRQEIFGDRAAAREFFTVTEAETGAVSWPVVWLEGGPLKDSPIAGIHAFAISGANVQWLFSNGQSIASLFSDGYARHCIFGGVFPSSSSAPPAEHADEVFDLIANQLCRAHMNWRNVARTWIYMDRILDWYGEFNHVRKEAFDRFEIPARAMPASTGIGASNLADAALTVGLWAIQPLDYNVSVTPLPSPLQCSARDYGSCFSRAVEISTPDLRRVFISGTASISPDGATVHPNDVWKQIELTFEVVEAILRSRAMRWTDVSRATAYLKNPEHAKDAACFFAEQSASLPVISTRADICRDDLLFEIELDAIASTARPSKGDWQI